LDVEVLEERCLLAGAVGSFLRTDGGVHASAGVGAGVPNDSEGSEYVIKTMSVNGTVLVDANVRAVVSNDGFAFGEDQGFALVPTEVNSATTVPQLSAYTFSKTAVDDHAVVYIGYGSGFSSGSRGQAFGQFQYVPDPQYTQNLWYHGHFFIAGDHGAVVSGDAEVYGGDLWATVNDSQAGGGYVRYVLGSDDIWQWSFFNGELQGESIGGVNLHVVYSVPLEGFGRSYVVQTNQEVYARALFTGDFAESATRIFAATWGYVTAGPDGATPGDFNYDGNVDGDDFDIWAQELPQSDVAPIGQPDGIVDEQDYAAWAANAKVILVSTAVDENDGDYSYGDLSLREAIAVAADANHPGMDIIAFDGSLLGSTITLTMGGLTIGGTNEVKILGPGADQLTIHGNGGNIAIFTVLGGGGAPITSTISHLKLTGTANGGAGVLHSDSNGNHDLILDSLEIVDNGSGVKHTGSGQLVILNSLVAQNSWDGIARTTSSPPQDFASMTIIDTIVRDNGRNGVNLRNMDVTISGSEISGNNWRGLLGKGVNFESNDDNPSVTLTIENSTIAENHGQGIALANDTIANIANTTISSNEGLGLSVTNGEATLTNVTVTQNRVATSGATAGVYVGAGGTITMHNTIVAQNYSGTGESETDADLGRATGSPAASFNLAVTSYNLVGVVGNSGITSSNNNIILNGADAGLMALGDYGGKTRTHALLLSSLAIDAGDNSKAEAIDLVFDQRGYDRIVDHDGTPHEGFDIDIGAFELAMSEFFG